MNWKTWLNAKDVAKALEMNYTAMVGSADSKCDDTNLSHSVITVRGGIIVKMVQILDNPSCKLPDMRGWYVEELVDWINDGPIPGDLNMIAWR